MKKMSRYEMVKRGIISKRGVFNNIEDSDYIITDGELILYFTSEHNMNSFINSYKENRETYNEKYNRFIKGVDLIPTIQIDVELYKNSEFKGFHICLGVTKLDEKDIRDISLRRMMLNEVRDYKKVESIEELNSLLIDSEIKEMDNREIREMFEL